MQQDNLMAFSPAWQVGLKRMLQSSRMQIEKYADKRKVTFKDYDG